MVNEITRFDSHALPRGHEVGSFVIESKLGSGGFGITYLARDRHLDKLWAIKEYFPSGIAARTENGHLAPISDSKNDLFLRGRVDFLNEARILSEFKHDNIVAVSHVIERNNTAYMVMEYVEGQSLNSLVSDHGTLSEDRIRKILDPLLDALEVIHKQNVFHRDIKPSNILVTSDDIPHLIDFGSARRDSQEQTRSPQLGGQDFTVLTTDGYAPIEQYEGTQQGDYTDIYALGATLYFACFGKKPPDARIRSGAMRVRPGEIRLQNQDPLDLSIQRNDARFSNGLVQAIEAALALYPEDRPPTVKEWRSLLDNPPFIEPIPEESTGRTIKRYWPYGVLAIALVVATTVAVVLFQEDSNATKANDTIMSAHEIVENEPLDEGALRRSRYLYTEAVNIHPDSSDQSNQGLELLEVLEDAIASQRKQDHEETFKLIDRAKPLMESLALSTVALDAAIQSLNDQIALNRQADERKKLEIKLDSLIESPFDVTVLYEFESTIMDMQGQTFDRQNATKLITSLRTAWDHISSEDFSKAKSEIEKAIANLQVFRPGASLDSATVILDRAISISEAAQAKNIEDLLIRARKAESTELLKNSVRRKSIEIYQTVLTIDPDNQESLNGSAFLNSLTDWQTAMDTEMFDDAAKALQAARTVPDPSDIRREIIALADSKLTAQISLKRQAQVEAKALELFSTASRFFEPSNFSLKELNKPKRDFDEILGQQPGNTRAESGLSVIAIIDRATKAIRSESFDNASAEIDLLRQELEIAQLHAHATTVLLKELELAKDAKLSREFENGIATAIDELESVAENDLRSIDALDAIDAVTTHYLQLSTLKKDDARQKSGIGVIHMLLEIIRLDSSGNQDDAIALLQNSERIISKASLSVDFSDRIKRKLERYREVANAKKYAAEEKLRLEKYELTMSEANELVARKAPSIPDLNRAKQLFSKALDLKPGDSGATAGQHATAVFISVLTDIDNEDYPSAEQSLEIVHDDLRLNDRKSAGTPLFMAHLYLNAKLQLAQRNQGIVEPKF